MLIRLPTVRSKLTALVSTTLVLMLAALPVLSWLLHRQLVDEVDDRVADAEKSFDTELKDDLDDLTLAARVMATDTDTLRAIQARDTKAADDLAEVFIGVYPDIDVLIAAPDGSLLAQVGCKEPVRDLGGVPEMAPALKGREMRGIVTHGCERGANAPPAYMIAAPVMHEGAVAGAVIVCLPLDSAHLANAAKKLGLALALVGPPPGRAVLDRAGDFPEGADIAAVTGEPAVVEGRGRSFAMARFQPAALGGSGGLSIVAALDVTDIQRLVRNNLLFALGVLAFAALVSIGFGLRLAQVMSSALLRVSRALKKLEQQEYVHIDTDAIKTGDELEDLANGFNLMVDGLKERDKLRTTFGKYMTSAVVDHLLSGKVALGGETLTVTILFSDIRSFTTISETMDAHELVGLLNEYFSEMVGIIMDEDGVVDKYIGDAIMAVFGAPVPKPDDAVRAVRAAVRMRKALSKLNERLTARGIEPLHTGIGIHTGPVVAGNIGSERRMEYTVIGDPVNLASRLESSTKDLKVDVLLSEDTYHLVEKQVIARPVKEITVKGRAQPVTTYELLGLAGEPPLSGRGEAKEEREAKEAEPAKESAAGAE
jgi:adenylate cyclase